jgi:hypothetical protein
LAVEVETRTASGPELMSGRLAFVLESMSESESMSDLESESERAS